MEIEALEALEALTILTLSLEEVGQLFVTSIPIGFVIGCIPMVIGVAIHGLINIIKRT